MNTRIPFVVFCIGHAGGAEFEHALLRKHDIKYKAGTGSHMGHVERCYLSPCNPGYAEPMWRRVLELTNTYLQKSVLAVDSTQYAVLISPRTGKVIKDVGKWREEAPSANARDYTSFDGRMFHAG